MNNHLEMETLYQTSMFGTWIFSPENNMELLQVRLNRHSKKQVNHSYLLIIFLNIIIHIINEIERIVNNICQMCCYIRGIEDNVFFYFSKRELWEEEKNELMCLVALLRKRFTTTVLLSIRWRFLTVVVSNIVYCPRFTMTVPQSSLNVAHSKTVLTLKPYLKLSHSNLQNDKQFNEAFVTPPKSCLHINQT